MIPCPKCNSEETRVETQVIHVDNVSFQWKSKGKGVKQQKYRLLREKLPLADVRVFLSCNCCDYYSDNLNGYDEIAGYDDEVNLILDQVEKSIKGIK